MILAIDGRNARLTVWLLRDQRVRRWRSRPLASADRILPFVARSLAAARAPLARVRRLVVVSGPGAFSYLRASLSVAKALALALRVPVAVMRASDPETPVSVLAITAAQPTRRFETLRPFYGRRPKITLKAKRT